MLCVVCLEYSKPMRANTSQSLCDWTIHNILFEWTLQPSVSEYSTILCVSKLMPQSTFGVDLFLNFFVKEHCTILFVNQLMTHLCEWTQNTILCVRILSTVSVWANISQPSLWVNIPKSSVCEYSSVDLNIPNTFYEWTFHIFVYLWNHSTILGVSEHSTTFCEWNLHSSFCESSTIFSLSECYTILCVSEIIHISLCKLIFHNLCVSELIT